VLHFLTVQTDVPPVSPIVRSSIAVTYQHRTSYFQLNRRRTDGRKESCRSRSSRLHQRRHRKLLPDLRRSTSTTPVPYLQPDRKWRHRHAPHSLTTQLEPSPHSDDAVSGPTTSTSLELRLHSFADLGCSLCCFNNPYLLKKRNFFETDPFISKLAGV
jgi:hypothetical protein